MAEAIRFFDVELDITDRQVLYDYDKGEKVERPTDGWNASARKELSRRASLDHVEDNESFSLRVGLMDHTWMHKSILEKRAESDKKVDDEELARQAYAGEGGILSSQEEEEDDDHDEGAMFGMRGAAKSEIYLPRRVLPVYEPGDVVKGTVVLDLAKSLPANSLSINFLGRTQIQIRVYHARGYYDHRKSEDYIDETLVLWKTSDSAQDISEAFSLLSTNTQVVSKTLPAGCSRFPFEFTIPTDGQGSIPQLIPGRANYAHLVYRFKATIDPGIMSRDIIRTRGIWVERPYDIASVPGHMKPVSAEEIHKTGVLVTTGKVVLRVTLPRKAWLHGEVLPLKVDVENKASNEIAAVKARVMLQGKSRSSDSLLAVTNGIKIQGIKCKDGPIPGGQSRQFQWQLPLDFSESSVDSNLVPVGPLDCYKLLDIRYEVVVTAKRKGLHRDITLSLPITLGNKNSQA